MRYANGDSFVDKWANGDKVSGVIIHSEAGTMSFYPDTLNGRHLVA
eukprot:gene38295-47282_t